MGLEFKLPDIGEGLAEGEIVRWHVKEGQAVRENDPFVDVMTDKATVEITAPATGTVTSIRSPAGKAVPVGSVIAVIETAGGGTAPAPGAKAEKVEAAASAKTHAKAEARAPVAAVAATATEERGNGATLVAGRALAAPAVRRRARELGVDLRQVAGSGPAGRIRQADLEKFVQASAVAPVASRPSAAVVPASAKPAIAKPPAPSATPAGPLEERIPLRGIRKRIAERMAKSKRTAAHFTYVDELDATELVALREVLKPPAAEEGVKLTYMPFIVAAVCGALKKFPMLNAALDDDKQEIVVKHAWHIGFACDTDQGLVVPVIKDADRRSLLNLGAAIQDLSTRAREGKLTLDEVTGSTFTITNAGNIGGILATPVINHPEVAILGVHKLADRAVVRNGAIVIRKTMNLSVSIDHRVVDGADGARFMNEVLRLLEDPRRMMLGSL